MPAPIPEIRPQTVTIKAPPTPKKPKPLHPEPAPLGRGGSEHKYLQGLIKQAGEAHGYRAVIEKGILNGQGKVDVSLERDDETIACEISVTSTPEQELENVRKRLKADYRKVVVLASSAKRLKALRGHGTDGGAGRSIDPLTRWVITAIWLFQPLWCLVTSHFMSADNVIIQEKSGESRMKVLVCGGRRFSDINLLNNTLNTFRSSISVLISNGNARGADQLGEQWAKTNGVEIDRYPAQWNIYGKSADFQRNEQMIREGKPNVVIAFRGGAGTAHMVRTAKAANIKVWEIS